MRWVKFLTFSLCNGKWEHSQIRELSPGRMKYSVVNKALREII